MTDQPAIQTNGLQKSYRTGGTLFPVLNGIDLTVPSGECLFLVGPSGSGKTTLLSILGCVLSPDAGTLEILGQDVSRLSPTAQAHFRRERIGFVFQRYHLFDGLRVWENVRIVFDLLGRPHAEGKLASLELLERVGLKDRTHHRVNQLSMGQRQRVAIARALAANPDLILADEPTASLDAESGQNAMSILKELCRELQKTVVVVTHDSRIFPLADRILSLEAGRIAQQQGGTRDASETPQTADSLTNSSPLAAIA